MAATDNTDELKDLENDFAILVRLSAQDSLEDVRLLLAKLVRKYRTRRPEFAERINQALRTTQTRSAGTSILRRGMQHDAGGRELPVDADTRMSLIRIFDDLAGLEAPLLPAPLDKQIQSIIRERRERAKLAAHGVRPTRSAILVGPPGVGKTLSARWIACQIGKPLWVLDLTTVMSSLLGKTGNNLRMVFDHARANEAVLLLDEIDAIAKRRSDESDVGELKRLVTAILQEVDAWPDTGLLLAATNHPELVDPALWRRFDAILTFEMSDPATIAVAVRRFLGADAKAFEPVVALLAASLQGNSLSDVERAVTTLRRSAVLEGTEPTDVVVAMAAQHVERLDKAARLNLAIELARTQEVSHNKIMALTGVARDTIRKYAGPSPIKGRGGRKDA
ncbi:MAG: AAA family ATPase [Dechloromonas sp.]|nr:AAA family ATPase [Dechloromonas sp.]